MTQSAPPHVPTTRRPSDPSAGPPVPVQVSEPASAARGVTLLVHGRNGAPDQPQIAEIATAYLERGWRVVAPELPNSSALPGSGPPEQVTFTGHHAAAKAAWDWAQASWPDVSNWALAGHSLGAFAVAQIAAQAETLHHVLAVSPVLSGRALVAARNAMGPAAIEEVAREAPDYYAQMTRRETDAAPALGAIAAPLGVVTGALDGIVPPAHARAYFAAAGNGRFFGALPDTHHCPAGPGCHTMLSAALDALDA